MTRAIPQRAAIEVDLPVELMHDWAIREGNRKKPIYELHKWWARRLGSTFRMILLAATAGSATSRETWRKRFFEDHDYSGLTVLDPFMGGGTSLVEAAKLGAHVIGVDIDPVACFVTSRELAAVDPKKIRTAYEGLANKVRDRILARYKTELPDGRPASIIYSFWVDEVLCPDCGVGVAAHPHYQLARHHVSKKQTVLCRECGTLRELAIGQERFKCTACSAWTSIAEGPTKSGRLVCPSCSSQHPFSSLSSTTSLPHHRLFALDVTDEKGERSFKAPDARDHAAYAKSVAEWNSSTAVAEFAPIDLIPKSARYDNRPLIYGYRRYSELFNPRQLLSLCEIAAGIAELTDPVEREFLALAFSDCLASNNMFCSFAFDYRKLTPLFGLHAFRRVVRPVENNVWGLNQGRGTFSRCVEKVIRGKEYGLEPYEFEYEGGKPIPRKTGGRIAVDFVGDKPTGQVLNCSASSLAALTDASVDLVLTDPPYYDNLPYSELSDFYHVWLRRLLGKNYFGTASAHTPSKSSLFVGRKGRVRSKEHTNFVENLSAALTECSRVLRENGLLVFTFHHADVNAWMALGMALMKSPFVVTKVLPVRSEGSSAFHSYDGSLKWDAVMVCRKKDRRAGEPERRALQAHVRAEKKYWKKRLGVRMRTPDLRSLGHALAIQYLSRYVLTPSTEKLLAGFSNPRKRKQKAGGRDE